MESESDIDESEGIVITSETSFFTADVEKSPTLDRNEEGIKLSNQNQRKASANYGSCEITT